MKDIAQIAEHELHAQVQRHIEGYVASLNRDVAVEAPETVESLLASSGFEAPARFCQTLLIHAWCTRRAS